MENILNFFRNYYPYVAGLMIALLAVLDLFDAWRDKKKFRLICYAIAIVATVITPIQELVTNVAIQKDEFSTRIGNISFKEGSASNIILETKKDIEEPIDLRIKDTWIHLSYLTDYDMKDKRKIIINYEFGNDKETNKRVAEQGLVFTYKTRKMR
jgi:hypothetical protein